MKLSFLNKVLTGMILLCITLEGAGQVVFQNGNTYKLSIGQDGVYKIDSDLLKKMGLKISDLNPSHLKIYGNPGGMLPQANDASRPEGLIEHAIFVSGEADGKFDQEDYILFYAEGADEKKYDPIKDVFSVYTNLYASQNFYFLVISDSAGKRISTSENISGNFPLINSFNDYVFHESELTNIEKSGRDWYGEAFRIDQTELPLNFKMSGVVSGSNLKIVSNILGRSYSNASFKLIANGVEIAEQPVLPIAAATYALKGYDRTDTISVNESTISASTREEQEFTYKMIRAASGFSEGNLDFILISYQRNLSLYGNQTIFTTGSSLLNNVSTFQIANAGGSRVWDISDFGNPKEQAISSSGTGLTFSTSTELLKTFIVFNNNFLKPEFTERVSDQNIRALSTPDLLIITHPLFKAEADRLANHRQSFSNWTTQVVTIQQIYNEFSSGRQDVTAIRDFVKHLYDKNPSQLKALLLFGKGSYDYKDLTPDNKNFVPTYESRNSLHPLQTYSSDDYFGFLEEAEGEWSESPAKNHSLDIGVGRLPVTTIAEAKNVVDKIIKYDQSKTEFGAWRKEIAFVADDGSDGDGWTSLHQFQANSLATMAEELDPGFDTKKLFMGTYKKTLNGGSESVPEMSNDLLRVFSTGAVIINFTGHGSEDIWTDEAIFSAAHIEKLNNDFYPFLVTATCEFGRQDNPGMISSAELCVTKANGGAIGLVTTARPVNATTNFDLNKAFYEALFIRNNNDYTSIGQVFRQTKNFSVSGVSNRNFSLIGDPSLTLALPPDLIKITSIKTDNGSDTLKALSKVIVKGQIENAAGEKISTFNGKLQADLFDKATDRATIGRNKPAFQFKEWNNILFRGQATVRDGEFELTFILPKNISYAIDGGRMSLYAADQSTYRQAKGLSTDFKIGGGEANPPSDNISPEVKAYIGDTTFVNGGITTPDSWLIVALSDNSGINISGHGIGNSLIAVLDDDVETYVLNEYYVASLDSYKKGIVSFPLKNISPGKHKITIKAWDVYNNPASASVDFLVTDSEGLLIEEFGNFPNPFIDKSTLFFTHNRSGDDLEARVFIYSPSGQLIQNKAITVDGSAYRVDLMEIDTGSEKKLPAGIYFARLVVRSLTNGSKNEQLTKLIILN